jgi:hypothetical protein
MLRTTQRTASSYARSPKSLTRVPSTQTYKVTVQLVDNGVSIEPHLTLVFGKLEQCLLKFDSANGNLVDGLAEFRLHGKNTRFAVARLLPFVVIGLDELLDGVAKAMEIPQSRPFLRSLHLKSRTPNEYDEDLYSNL